MRIQLLLSIAFSYAAAKSMVVQTPGHHAVKREALSNKKDVQISEINIRSDIQYRYSRTTVESYIKNFGENADVAEFKATLPESAFISKFSMTVKNVEYVAEIMAKDAAKKTFDQQVESGAGAGLVEQDTREKNIFVVSANVEPGEKVLFRLTYDELLERRLGLYQQAISVNPGQIVDDFNIQIYINESLPISSLSVPEMRRSNKVQAIATAQSSLANISKNFDGDSTKALVEFSLSKEDQAKEGAKGIKGDFIIQYDVERKSSSEVQVIDGHFVHFFAPENLKVLPKHVIFVLDVSGSMSGEKLEQMKDAMFTVLDEMTDEDHFNIITFSSGVQEWSPPNPQSKSTKASSANKDIAIDFILSLRARGGTNIDEAMQTAIQLGKAVQKQNSLSKGVKSMILFLTDGQPSVGRTGHTEITEHINTLNPEGLIPIFTLAFGSDADFDLMKSIAEDSGSRAKQIYEGSDAALQLEGFYKEISSPLLSDLKFSYVGQAVDQGSLTNTDLKTFFKGTEYIICGNLDNKPDTFTVNIEGIGGSIGFHEHFDVPSTPPPVRSNAQVFLKNLYAFLNIKQLLKSEEGQANALEMSLKNNFVTKLTSLIVKKEDNIKEEAVFRKSDKKAMPQGSTRSASYPSRRVGGGRRGSKPRRKVYHAYSPQAYQPSSHGAVQSMMNYDHSYDSSNIHSFHQQTTLATTTTISSQPCLGKLTLYSKTYGRGENITITESSMFLTHFEDLAVSGEVEGSCCWVVYAGRDLEGANLELRSGVYSSVTSLGGNFRNLKSAQKIEC